jgi:hypothetical protein
VGGRFQLAYLVRDTIMNLTTQDAQVACWMRLRGRWSGWTREPFTGDSRQHVSVWEKPVRQPA